MPFCPKCRYEYREGITRCPDCDELLVSELPPLSRQAEIGAIDEKDWIPLVLLTSSQYAELVVEDLRAKDIPVVMRSNTGHFGETGQMGTSTFRPIGGGYIVFVPEAYIEQADNEGEAILGDVWTNSRLKDIRDGY